MKKSFWLAGALIAGTCSSAQAQSGVTIYGLMDAGFRYTKGGDFSKKELNYGTPPRLGFRGREDLGGGLSAFFVLEMGINSDTGTLGQGGRAFGRQSWVGLSSKGVGTLALGRGYDAMVDYLQPLTAGGQTWAGGLGAHWGDLDNVNNYFRVQNAVKFTSDDFSGFKFGGHYAFGEVADSTRKNSNYSLGASYAQGPLRIAAATMTVNNPIASVFDGNRNGSFQAGSPYVGLQAADKLGTHGVGATYTFGWRAARVGAVLTRTRLTRSELARGDAVYKAYEVNAQFDLTPALQLGTAYSRTTGNWLETDQRPKFSQINVGAVYKFSKTTSIYTQIAHQRAGGDALMASINLLPASSNRSQTVTQVAFRVIF